MNWWTAWLNKKVQERTLQYLPVLREKGPAVRGGQPQGFARAKGQHVPPYGAAADCQRRVEYLMDAFPGSYPGSSRLFLQNDKTVFEHMAAAANGWHALNVGSQTGRVSGKYSEITEA